MREHRSISRLAPPIVSLVMRLTYKADERRTAKVLRRVAHPPLPAAGVPLVRRELGPERGRLLGRLTRRAPPDPFGQAPVEVWHRAEVVRRAHLAALVLRELIAHPVHRRALNLTEDAVPLLEGHRLQLMRALRRPEDPPGRR